MIDNLQLPQPPTATGTPAYIRYSFYNIPFSRDGEDVFLPKNSNESDIARDLYVKNCLKYEVITNRAFRSEQGSIVFPQDAQLNNIAYNVNYCRVAIVDDPQTELYEYLADHNANYYWIDNAEFLSVLNGFTGGAIQFDISKDYLMTHLMIGRVTGKPIITGNVDITNDDVFLEEVNAKAIGEADYKKVKAQVATLIDAYISYALIVCYTDKDGALFTEVVKCNEGKSTTNPYDTYLNLIECVELASGAAKVNIEAADLGNISVKNIYALPLEWVEGLVGDSTIGVKTTNTGLHLYSFNNINAIYKNTTPVFEYSGTPSEIQGQNIWDRCFLRLPSKLIELKGNPLRSDFFDFKIFMDIPLCGIVSGTLGGGTDTITFTLYVNGEYIDVSNVFSIDFGVNEAALRQNQFKELTVLEGVAAAIGAVGGVAGGVSSGNYFGAVQSAVGGVEKIGSIISASKQPAQLRSAGSFTNGLAQYGLFAFLYFKDPVNKIDLQILKNKYGWALADTTPINSVDITNSRYYKLSNVSVAKLPRCGETAAAIIAARFEQGIRFKEL